MSKELALVLSNRVNISDQYTQIVELCGNQAQQYEYSADPGSYADTMQFNNIVPIGSLSSTLLSKSMKLRYTVRVTVVDNQAIANGNYLSHTFPADIFGTSVAQVAGGYGGTAGGTATPVVGVNSGFRAFPLQSVCDNISISLNNAQTSWNARQTISGLQRLLDKKALMSRAGECPCRPDDQFTLYPDAVSVDQALNLSPKAHLGYTRNSLTATAYTPKAGAGGTSVYTYEITEDLLIPGVNSLFDNEAMIANVNNMSLILNYGKLQTDFFSAAAVWGGVSQLAYTDAVSIAIISPYLVLEYQQIDPNLVSIPKSVVYPYEGVTYFPNSLEKINLKAGQSITASSQTVRFNSLPKRIGVWTRPLIVDRNSNQADACLTLNKDKGCFNINLGARSGLLAQCSRDEMWRLSVQAGSNQTRDSFVFGAGSFVWIDPITAFGVNASAGDLLPGENGSLNFQCTAKYDTTNVWANLQGAAANSQLTDQVAIEMMIIAIYEGQMIASPDMFAYNIGVLSPAEVSQLVDSGSGVSKEAIKKEINGAGLYTDKGVLHKAAHSKKRGGILTMA